MTLNAESLMTMLSNSVIDRWWENYWIIKSRIMDVDKRPYFSVEIKFYILSQAQKPSRTKNH